MTYHSPVDGAHDLDLDLDAVLTSPATTLPQARASPQTSEGC
jgi:hypothetical protein